MRDMKMQHNNVAVENAEKVRMKSHNNVNAAEYIDALLCTKHDIFLK